MINNTRMGETSNKREKGHIPHENLPVSQVKRQKVVVRFPCSQSKPKSKLTYIQKKLVSADLWVPSEPLGFAAASSEPPELMTQPPLPRDVQKRRHSESQIDVQKAQRKPQKLLKFHDVPSKPQAKFQKNPQLDSLKELRQEYVQIESQKEQQRKPQEGKQGNSTLRMNKEKGFNQQNENKDPTKGMKFYSWVVPDFGSHSFQTSETFQSKEFSWRILCGKRISLSTKEKGTYQEIFVYIQIMGPTEPASNTPWKFSHIDVTIRVKGTQFSRSGKFEFKNGDSCKGWADFFGSKFEKELFAKDGSTTLEASVSSSIKKTSEPKN